MTGVTQQSIERSTPPSTADVAADASLIVPLLVVLCWMVVMLAFLRTNPAGRARDSTRTGWRRAPPDSARPGSDGGTRGSGWHAPLRGPPVPDVPVRSGWLLADRVHEVPVQVVAPTRRHGARRLDRTAAEMLGELAAPVLTAGRRAFSRRWGGVLLHGGDTSEITATVSAVASEHGVPLLVVRSHDLLPVDHRPVVAPVVDLAVSQGPCVLLIQDIDDLTDPTAALVVSRQARRVEHELLTAVRTLDADAPVVVVATARSPERVAPALLQERCLDRVISVGLPTARHRAHVIRQALLTNHAVLDGDVADTVARTAGLSRSDIVQALHHACRLARRRDPLAEPLVITAIDVRAALRARSTPQPLAIGARRETWVRDVAHAGQDPDASFGLVLAGDPDNGPVEVAHWVATHTGRPVAWLDAAAIHVGTADEVEALVRAACDDLPVVVVWERLDDLLRADEDDGRRRKSALAALEHLARTPGTGVVATVRDPGLLDPDLVDDGTLEVLWLPAPDHHARVALIEHALRGADLIDTTAEQLAADLHGATRAQVITRCRAALRAAAARNGLGTGPRPVVLRADFARPRAARA